MTTAETLQDVARHVKISNGSVQQIKHFSMLSFVGGKQTQESVIGRLARISSSVACEYILISKKCTENLRWMFLNLINHSRTFHHERVYNIRHVQSIASLYRGEMRKSTQHFLQHQKTFQRFKLSCFLKTSRSIVRYHYRKHGTMMMAVCFVMLTKKEYKAKQHCS